MEKRKKICCIAIAAIALLILIVLFYPTGGQSAGEFYPGFACSEDSDCEFVIPLTVSNPDRMGMCQNPEDLAEFSMNPFEIDESKVCYCGPNNECRSTKPTFFEKIRAFIKNLRERLGIGPRVMY